MKTFLFIDDDARFLKSMERIFMSWQNVIFAECHDTEAAMLAIQTHNPDVIFLDHELTEGGDEGLRIAISVLKSRNHVKIYSTTGRYDMIEVYEKSLGIKWIDKYAPIYEFKKIILSH